MGLTRLAARLLRAAACRPHVLLVAVPGAIAVRLAAEEQLRVRGWPVAMSPADADILLVCGEGGGRFMSAVEEAWRGMPSPRARVTVGRPAEAARSLDKAQAWLGDLAQQRELATASRGRRPGSGGHGTMHHGGMPARRDQMSGAQHGGMEGMELPGGLPMAGRGDDRDGLRLDRLHLRLGPVLPDWPAGLAVRLTLQGDVIQRAEPEALYGGGGSFWDEPWQRAAAGEHVTTGDAAKRRAAAHLDSLARFAGVAGWDAAAVTARRLRDGVLAGAPGADLPGNIRRFARRVAASRALAWLTGGLGVLAGPGAGGPVPGPGGDVPARYRRWCADLEEAAAALGDVRPLRPGGLGPPRGPAEDGRPPSAALLEALAGLLAGTELGAARLIVASLDPDLDQLPFGVEAGRGR